MKWPEDLINKVICGDCLEAMKGMPDDCIDTIITDPPYGIGFMGKEWDVFKSEFVRKSVEKSNRNTVKKDGMASNSGIRYDESLSGHQKYQDWCVEWMEECLRIAKPGATFLCCGSPRVYHHIALATERAGWILKDCIMWLYGSGFPKATDISKQIDKKGGHPTLTYEIAEALKQARTSRGMTKTQADKMFCGGTTLYSWYEGRPAGIELPTSKYMRKIADTWPELEKYVGLTMEAEREVMGKSQYAGRRPNDRSEYNLMKEFTGGSFDYNITAPATPEAILWNGWKSHGLKPAYEPILVAMKPNEGSYANNALKWGVAGLNIDGGRIGTNRENEREYDKEITSGKTGSNKGKFKMGENQPRQDNWLNKGRYPANVILEKTYIQILILIDNCDKTIKKTIGEYYDNYEVPDMWERVPDLSEQSEGWEGKVLQQKMLLEGSKRLPTANAREKTQRKVIKENETEQKEYTERKGKQKISGILLQQGIQISESGRVEHGGIDDSNTNDKERIPSRTQINNGNENEKTIKEKRDSSSQEWDKKRQQDKEFRNNEQYKPYKNSFRVNKGKYGTEKRERKIEILISDIPKEWLKYFKPTGFSIIDSESSARLLDEQSGELKPPWGRESESQKDTSWFSGKTDSYGKLYRDIGGASRFFYCAKASKAERNRGCEGLEEKISGGMKGTADQTLLTGSGNIRNNKAKNNHPTVKPLSLMRYLCTLTRTPTGGIVLDPFCGSGTTLMACKGLKRDYIGIDNNSEYCEIARRRINATPEPLF